MRCYKFTRKNINSIRNFCCGIYAIRNDIDNNMYVGSSTNIKNRLGFHLQNLSCGKKIHKTAGGYKWKYTERKCYE